MLTHLCEQVHAALADTHSVTLATSGPAGVQASLVACEACDLQLYLLVPQTSEHLVNLEDEPVAVATTAAWSVRGEVHSVSAVAQPEGLTLASAPDACWYTLVVLRPSRFERLRPDGWGALETIDIE